MKKKQPPSVYWKPKEGSKYPPSKLTGCKWLIYTQNTHQLQPNEGKRITLNFGYAMSEGTIAISPTKDLNLRMGITNSVFIDSETPDIQVYIFNFSKNILLIPENSPFCFVQYLKP